MRRVKQRWIYVDGEAIEVSTQRRARRPLAPAVMQDTLDRPYWNAHAGKMVDTRSEHRRILREKGLIELGNEKDAWLREIRNPDFDDEGRPVWKDERSEAEKSVYEENSRWLEKQASR